MRALALLLALGSATAAPVTLIKTYDDGIELLHWTDTGGTLSGTFQVVYRANGTPPSLKTSNATFTGTRHGNTVTLRFTETALGFTDTRIWTGTLKGNALSLTRPMSSGGLNTVTFVRGSPETYNRTVAVLRQAVQADRTRHEEAQAQQRAAQAQQDALRVRVRTQTQAVEETDRAARRALEAATSLARQLSQGVQELHGAVKLLQEDFADLRRDQAQLLREAAEVRSCHEVSVVKGYSLSTLSGYSLNQLTGYDTSHLNYYLQELGKNLAETRSTLTVLEAATQAHRTVPAANPQAQVRLTVTPQQIKQGSTELKVAGELATAAMKEATTTHTVILRDAQALVDEARTVAAGLTCQAGS